MNEQYREDPEQILTAETAAAAPRRRRRSDRHAAEQAEAAGESAAPRTPVAAEIPAWLDPREDEDEAEKETAEAGDGAAEAPDGMPERVRKWGRGQETADLAEHGARTVAMGAQSRIRVQQPSRVPMQARRMSETPYGMPGTGARPAGNRPVPERPAEGAGSGEVQNPTTLRVGYAPGRMGSAATRKIPVAGADEEGPVRSQAPAGRREWAAPAKTRQRERIPAEDRRKERVPGAEDRRKERRPGAEDYLQKNKRRRRGWIIALAAVLVLALAAVVILKVLPEDNGVRRAAEGLLGTVLPADTGNPEAGEPTPIKEYTVAGNEGQTAPASVTFSVTADKRVTEIRLADPDGNPMEVSMVTGDNSEDNVWILTLTIDEAVQTVARLQIYTQGEWRDTPFTTRILVNPAPGAESAAAAQAEEEAEEPAQDAGDETAETGPEEDGTPEADAGDPAPEEEPEAAGDGGETTEEPAEPDGAEAEADLSGTEEETVPEDAETEETLPEEAGTEAQPAEDGNGAETAEGQTKPADAAPEGETAEAAPEEEAGPVPLEAVAAESADPSLISKVEVYSGSKKVKDYARAAKELIHMPAGKEYTVERAMGVFTFRGNAFRQNAAVGTVEDASGLRQIWEAETGSARGAGQNYYGVSWTGQPLIIKWSKEIREKSNMYESKLEKTGLKEVIIAGMDGVIRFLDLADGTLTRNSIKLGYPMKGTPSVHAGGYPYMNVGQFARKMKVKTGKIGLRQYNLYSQKEMTLIDGLDGKLHRAFSDVGSFETSALIDRTSDSLITAGTNGMLYLISMGSHFDYEAGVYTQSPSMVVMRSKAKGEKDADTAVESSLAMYDRYVFYADMGGILRCVDTNTLRPVWAVDTGDSVMAAVALDLNGEGGLDLYTANMLSKRKKGSAQIRCYDAMSGAEKWLVEVPVRHENSKDRTDVGVKASPLVGQYGLNGLVFFTVTGLSDEGRETLGLSGGAPAALIALDKETGEIAWVRGLEARSESSPTAVYDAEQNGWIIQCASDGKILLLDGLTGEQVAETTVMGPIEGSPAVYNNMMIVATTGKGTSMVYGIQIGSDRPVKTAQPAE